MTTTQGMYVEGRYVPAGPWAAQKIEDQVDHLKGSFRPGEAHEERTLFDAYGEVADRAAARALLTAAIGPKVAFHRLGLAQRTVDAAGKGRFVPSWRRTIKRIAAGKAFTGHRYNALR